MHRCSLLVLMVAALATPVAVRADLVLDWNATMVNVMQQDGFNPDNRANPGWATRTMAMMNGAIYDAFQAIDRTHAPFMVNQRALPGTSRDAAVSQAAYEILLHAYPSESALLDANYSSRIAAIPDTTEKANGIGLGSFIAQEYIAARAGDNSSEMVPYQPKTDPGYWRPDPFHPDQEAWGPEWGSVRTFAILNTADYVDALPAIPGMTSPEYAAAFQEVKELGAINSATRTMDETMIGVFWGYDRPTMGPPPVLFNRNLQEIATQAGNSTEQNARLFAMASVAMADAAIAAWDAKFKYDLWRPVTAIHQADTDGNPDTVADPAWRPLGAPGDPDVPDSNFTPPFPAWPSGHASMGGAAFETLRLFYGTNVFAEIDGIDGSITHYQLTSDELDLSDVVPPEMGKSRYFNTFSSLLDSETPDLSSPEWENAISRVYLGIHWRFDATDGITLGNEIARYITAHRFQVVPEPATVFLLAAGLLAAGGIRRSRKRSTRSHPPRSKNSRSRCHDEGGP